MEARISQNKQEKQLVVSEIKDKYETAHAVVGFIYKGLSVAKFEELRKLLKKSDIEIKVYKNTLFAKAVDANEEVSKQLVNSIAYAFSYKDQYLAHKLIHKFAKANPQIEISFSFVDKKWVNKDESMIFATLPSREELIAKFMGSIMNPIRKFAATISSIQK